MKLQTPIIKARKSGRISVIMNGFTKGRAKRYIKRYAKRLGLSVTEWGGVPDLTGENVDVWYVNNGLGQVRIMYWQGEL